MKCDFCRAEVDSSRLCWEPDPDSHDAIIIRGIRGDLANAIETAKEREGLRKGTLVKETRIVPAHSAEEPREMTDDEVTEWLNSDTSTQEDK